MNTNLNSNMYKNQSHIQTSLIATLKESNYVRKNLQQTFSKTTTTRSAKKEKLQKLPQSFAPLKN